MLIMALDLAVNTGVAIGRADGKPRVNAVRLNRRPKERDIACLNMACFLRDTFVLERPDLIAVENFMNPVASKSADATISAISLDGVVAAMAGLYGVRLERVAASTWRKHFQGRASAGARPDTKAVTLKQAKLLGYLPADCRDDNKGDACGIWDWAAHTYGRRNPAALEMFAGDAR